MFDWLQKKRKREMQDSRDEDRMDERESEMAEERDDEGPPGPGDPEAAGTSDFAPADAREDEERDSGLSPAMQIRDRIIGVLKTIYDPEIPVDIYELGLIYGVEVTDDGEAHITMTLTTPMCPVAETLPPEVEDKVRNVLGVTDVSLDLVWDPPWSVDMLSDAARLELNLM